MTAEKRPFFTANRVTFARLVSMPVLAWLLYQDTIWAAFALGVVIGSTDFVDGYLARKHGATVLGSLMDPIADKVFIAIAYIPFTDRGYFPAWATALLFVREFLVTALRTSYELRGLAMKTSLIAKIKTWVQMAGIGYVWLFLAVPTDRAMYWFMGGLHLGLCVLWLAVRGWRGRPWFTGMALVVGFTLQWPVYALGGVAERVLAAAVIVVGITWYSGIDYLVAGVRDLRHHDFNRDDAVRLLGGVGVPVAIVSALMYSPASSWVLMAILSLELAVGGLDNVLAHHKAQPSALRWAARTLATTALLVAAVVLGQQHQEAAAQWCSYVALAVSGAGALCVFWRNRDYYLDKRLRDRALRAA